MNYLKQRKISAQVRINKKLYSKKTNFPFLSGDGFAQVCGAVYGSPIGNQTSLYDAKSIFCHSDQLETFVSEHGASLTSHTLLVGNSDRDFYELDIELPSTIKRVYLQNSHISDGQIQTLPIGLENLRHGRHGLLKYFRGEDLTQEKIDAILVGPFSPTHAERKELSKWGILKSNHLKYVDHYVETVKLAEYSRMFKFVACPRGNGTDTHRFWETLYRGSIPVVKRSQWSRSISELGYPIMQLSEWSFDEFFSLSQSNYYQSFKPNEISKLWLNEWDSIINSNL
jgi:hypothetical protein